MKYILIPYITWVLFLAVMNLKRAKDNKTISKGALILGYPLLMIGLILDIVTNIIMSIPLLDFPKEPLFTGKLTRLIIDGGWRGKVAKFICSKLLDDFDPSGKHCE